MSAAPAYSLRRTLRALAGGWHEFFHSPCDARVCAAIRIAYATLILICLAILYPDLDRWFTDNGFLPADVSREIASPFAWSVLWQLPSTSAVVHTCYWVFAAQAALLLVGLLSRVNAACVFIWLVSFQMRNTVINDGEDTMFRLVGFLLIWMPIGQCWSVEAWLRRAFFGPTFTADPGKNDYAAPGWGLRLLQIEMAAMFFSAGLEKLAGEQWLYGTAMYYVSRLEDFFGRFPVPDYAFDTPWVVALMTWVVLIAELAVPILIWFKETRLPCLVVLLVFHLANEWMMHLFLFHWIMLCGWMAFLTPDDFRWLGRLRTGRAAGEPS